MSNADFVRPRLLPASIMGMAALLLLKSVILIQAAMAEAPPGPVQPAQAVPETPPKPSISPASSPKQTQPQQTETPVSDAERALLLDLRHRRAQLDQRAHDLDERQTVLEATQARLAARVDELKALQSKLETLETIREKHDAANWAGLVRLYEAMKPREAAAIFDSLDMQVLLGVLDRMNERKAAPILAAMQPDRARLVTQMLAELRTRAVTPEQAAPSQQGPKG